MNTARVMEDGDLRLPPEVSSKLNVKPGDSVGIDVDVDGAIRLYPKTLAIDDVCGKSKPPKDMHLTIEQINVAVSEAFRRGEL